MQVRFCQPGAWRGSTMVKAVPPPGAGAMGPNGQAMERPHCSLPCWWKGNRSWDRFKAMTAHMKVLYVWLQIAGPAHGLLSMLYSFAYKKLEYVEAENAMPLKDAAGGVSFVFSFFF